MSERNGYPIHVFRYESGKYRFDVKAFAEILSTCKDNYVSGISMFDPLHLGTTSMPDFFVRYIEAEGKGDWISKRLKNPFEYSGDSEREKSGIWIWSEPFVIERDDGTKVSVLLLNIRVQITNETSITTINDKATIFALSTLLSSALIVTVDNDGREEYLGILETFKEIIRLSDEEYSDELFPKLLFLVRDWQDPKYSCGYYDDQTSIDGVNIKTDALAVGEGMSEKERSARESILSSFENVSYYLMPKPGDADAEGDAFDVERVDRDLWHHLKQFVPLVLNRESIVAKRIGGRYITGAEFIVFVANWAELFERDTIPAPKPIYQTLPESVFEATATTSNRMAMSVALNKYTSTIEGHLIINSTGIPIEEFQLFYEELHVECVELFMSSKRLGGKAYDDSYSELLVAKLKEGYRYYSEMNAMNVVFNRERKHNADEKLRLEAENTSLRELHMKAIEGYDRLREEIRLMRTESAAYRFGGCNIL